MFVIVCSLQVTEICCYVYGNRSDCVKLCAVYSFRHHFASTLENMQSAANSFLHCGPRQKGPYISIVTEFSSLMGLLHATSCIVKLAWHPASRGHSLGGLAGLETSTWLSSCWLERPTPQQLWQASETGCTVVERCDGPCWLNGMLNQGVYNCWKSPGI